MSVNSQQGAILPSISPEQWPRWAYDLDRLLPVRSQFVCSGHVRDRFPVPWESGNDGQFVLCSFIEVLERLLRLHGYRYIVIYDRVDGFSVYPSTAENVEAVRQRFHIEFTGPHDHEAVVSRLPQTIRAILLDQEPIAVVLDYASRLSPDVSRLSEVELGFYTACEKLAYLARPRRISGQECSLFNPLIWILNRENDLPAWYTLDNENIHSLVVALPDFEARRRAARSLSGPFVLADAGDEQRERFANLFATLTENMSLQSMIAITQLARRLPQGDRNIADAVRNYQVGIADSPWKKTYVREKIQDATVLIGRRVKGQEAAIQRAVDILTRSVMGLSGAQAGHRQNRPKGVLFFAGPTGVGKTELAKSISELLFGDENAYVRFDMSEFAAEHADARLLGAPPGYVGYEAGGELTNAVREKPFCVLLFDEIEKAHPRILDKFLQILEDGRLTDGRGKTIYFSESVIIFTSNLGIYEVGEDGRRRLLVNQNDAFADIEKAIRSAIEHHFKVRLGRPELLNRLGDNIVVFDFIKPDVAVNILDKMIENISSRVRGESGVALEVSEKAYKKIQKFCAEDLSNGGRGIGNRLETVLINPLARSLFRMTFDETKISISGSGKIKIDDVHEGNSGIYTLIINSTKTGSILS